MYPFDLKKLSDLFNILERKGIPFSHDVWDITIVGITNNSDYDRTQYKQDLICVCYKDEQGDYIVTPTLANTYSTLLDIPRNPSIKDYLILTEGHYPNAFQIGQYSGVETLIQVNPMQYRLVKRNGTEFTCDKDVTLSLNMRTAFLSKEDYSINNWSEQWFASMQIINQDFDLFFDLIKKSAAITGKQFFNYSLINASEFQ